MGNATPAVSPPSQIDQLAGEVVSFEHQVVDMGSIGDTLAILSDVGLHIGKVQDYLEGSAELLDIPSSCVDMSESSAAESFVLACEQAVLVVPADDPEARTSTAVETTATTAALAGDTLVTGNETEEEIYIYRPGDHPRSIRVDDPTSQLISVQRPDQPESVVRMFRGTTIIQNVDLDNNRQGGTLRLGIGAGTIAPGSEGLVLASDAKASQLAVYTYEQVIRLQQTAPTAESPWPVAWDPSDQLAWTVSTAENVAVGHDISSGVPKEMARVNTIANAQFLSTLNDGTLVAASASGDGLHFFKSIDSTE